MKTLRLLVGLGAASLATLSLVAEIETPRVSLKSEVSQTIGFSEVTIVYSRPNDNGRQVFGGMVKNGQVWRTGANEATTGTETGQRSVFSFRRKEGKTGSGRGYCSS